MWLEARGREGAGDPLPVSWDHAGNTVSGSRNPVGWRSTGQAPPALFYSDLQKFKRE